MTATQDRSAVYQFFDLSGGPLYTGVTSDLDRRFREHRHTASWWPAVDPARTLVTWYATRKAAEAAEVSAIKAIRPRHNIQELPERYFGASHDDLSERQLSVIAQLESIRDPADRARQAGIAMQAVADESVQLSRARYGALAELRERGVSVIEISHMLGIHRDRVYELLRAGARRAAAE